MNRCSRPLYITIATGILGLLLALAPTDNPAQQSTAQATSATTHLPQRIPPISAKAMRGTLRIVQPPEVLLDGKPARLAPGARIRARNNLITVSGAFIGEDLPVRYTLDSLGLVYEVWVLTAAEVAAKY